MSEYFEAMEKKEDLCRILEGYPYEIHEKDEEEYKYLPKDSCCITVKDKNGKDIVYIDLEYEITLTCGETHCHYDCTNEDYEYMKKELFDFLEGRKCVVSIYDRREGDLSWMGSMTILAGEAEEKQITQIFSWVYKDKERHKRIKENGGMVSYTFYDADKCKEVEI